jgi:hypothetical protein
LIEPLQQLALRGHQQLYRHRSQFQLLNFLNFVRRRLSASGARRMATRAGTGEAAVLSAA